MAAKVVWAARKRQRLFIACPAFELLGWGDRGGGKSDALLFDFLADVGTGLGAAWRGLILRREYKDLVDIVDRSRKWIPQLFPGAKFHASPDQLGWVFPDGEKLLFRHGKKPDDIRQFLGQEWPWLGFDELCNWPTDEFYLDLISCARSANPAVRPRVRSTTNPWGPGAWWVKARFVDEAAQGKIIRKPVEVKSLTGKLTVIVTRAHLRMDFIDSALAETDPGYHARIMPSDPAKRRAWIDGEWDLSVGGFFSGVWDIAAHVVEPFTFPATWAVDRAHDWGSASPHCTIWFAESDGDRVEIEPGIHYTFPAGTLFGISEIYGWNGNANEGRRDSNAQIARDIKERDGAVERLYQTRVRRGPADTQIFDAPQGKAIVDEYRAEGVDFDPADKRAGSRITGAKALMDRLDATKPFAKGEPMEEPGLIFFDVCKHAIRTFPLVQRDDKDPDKIATDGEDHPVDSTRYRALKEAATLVVGRF